MHDSLNELRGFRHVARSHYGIKLKDDRIKHADDLMENALPRFVNAVESLIRHMSQESKHDSGCEPK